MFILSVVIRSCDVVVGVPELNRASLKTKSTNIGHVVINDSDCDSEIPFDTEFLILSQWNVQCRIFF